MREALENHPTENYLTGATQVPKTCAKDESGGAGRGRGKIGNWKLEIGISGYWKLGYWILDIGAKGV